MYRHVLCVYPYRVDTTRTSKWPPLGLELIATVLKPHAEALDIVDLRLVPGCTTDFLRPETDLICFSVNWARESAFVAEQIRSVPSDILTVVGGRHVTEDPEKWLSDCPNVDVVVRGDGEEAIDEIARGRPLGEVAGISRRADGVDGADGAGGVEKGRVVHNPVRRCKPVPDDLYPDRRLRRYRYPLLDGFGVTVTMDSVSSSRGCPFNCKFCSFSRNPWGTKRAWSARSPESVVRELEEIDERIVAFVDDNFTHDMDRVDAICDLLLQRGIRKRYAVNARVEIAKRPDVLRKMQRAGFSVLLLGIESATDASLRSMRKGFDTRQLREYFRVLGRTKMILHGYFIVGNIGESEADMRRIAPFAHELGIDSMVLCPLRREPYSGLEELVAASPGYHVAGNGKVYSDRYSVRRLRRIRYAVYRDFYTPAQILRLTAKGYRNKIPRPGMLLALPAALLAVPLLFRWRARWG